MKFYIFGVILLLLNTGFACLSIYTANYFMLPINLVGIIMSFDLIRG